LKISASLKSFEVMMGVDAPMPPIRMLAAAHSKNLMVLLDFVVLLNHSIPEGRVEVITSP
jgi:hypothetical protein